ncbi:hypothetical protein KSF78_0008515 [Schistosoma japonicum]|nr:hypothetical protein KSF78_0008515 [Schistosoma japonicum]
MQINNQHHKHIEDKKQNNGLDPLRRLNAKLSVNIFVFAPLTYRTIHYDWGDYYSKDPSNKNLEFRHDFAEIIMRRSTGGIRDVLLAIYYISKFN